MGVGRLESKREKPEMNSCRKQLWPRAGRTRGRSERCFRTQELGNRACWAWASVEQVTCCWGWAKRRWSSGSVACIAGPCEWGSTGDWCSSHCSHLWSDTDRNWERSRKPLFPSSHVPVSSRRSSAFSLLLAELDRKPASKGTREMELSESYLWVHRQEGLELRDNR